MGQNDSNTITFDLPIEELDKSILGTLIGYFLGLQNIIVNAKDNNDYRIYMLVRLMINTIPDRGERTKLNETFQGYIDKRLKKYDNPGTVDKNTAQCEASLEIIGDVSDYIDNFLGVHKKNVIIVE